MNNNRPIGAILAIMLVTVLVGIGAATGLSRLNNPNNYVGNDCFRFRSAIEHVNNQLTLAVWQDSRTTLETQRAELFQQAADAKCVEDVKRLPGVPPRFGEAPDTPSDSNWIHWFTKDPGKDKLRAFGPPVVVNNDQELWNEFERRIMVDPSLNCEDGGLILNDATDTFKCTTELMKSEVANKDYANRVMDNISSMELVQAYKQSGKVKVHTSYMAVNQDGIPVVYKIDMPRTEDYLVAKVTTKDGRVYVFVLKCGFQWEEGTNFNPPEQKVAKTNVTKRAKPIVESDKCVNGGERNDGGECVPPANNIIDKPKPESPKPEQPAPESPAPSEPPKPSESPQPSTEPKDPGEDINANPAIPEKEKVKPTQKAEPDQAQPEQPAPAPTTPRVDPAPPAPDPVPREDPAPPPPPEDDGPVNGGDPVAT